MSSNFLSGQKVKLRGLRKEDLEAYRRWLDDPDVTYFMEMGWRRGAPSACNPAALNATCVP